MINAFTVEDRRPRVSSQRPETRFSVDARRFRSPLLSFRRCLIALQEAPRISLHRMSLSFESSASGLKETEFFSNKRLQIVVMRLVPLIIIGLLFSLVGCDLLGFGDDAPSGDDVVTYTVRQNDGDFLMRAHDLSSSATQVVSDEIAFGRWAPDGRRLTHGGNYGGIEAGQIFVTNVTNGEQKIVTLIEQDGELKPRPINTSSGPVWSPDGDHVAYTQCRNCELGGSNREVYIIDLDNLGLSNEVRMTDNRFTDTVLDWSPDGETLLVYSESAPDGTYDRYGDIYAIDLADKSKRRILTGDRKNVTRHMRYSPSGDRVAFRRESDIYVANFDGTDRRKVTHGADNARVPDWSPDGTQLVYQEGFRLRPRGGHIYVVGADGSGRRRITQGTARYEAPQWRPTPGSR